MNPFLKSKDADGYGIIDSADTRGFKNAFIDHLQKLALENSESFKTAQDILDFGCGVGRMSHWLAEKCGRVHGIDVAEPLLKLAREKYSRPNITYQHYSGDTLPFSPSFFDSILSIGVLQKRIFPKEKLSGLVREFHRVLQTRGQIFVLEHIYGREHPRCYRREEFIAFFEREGFTCADGYPVRKGKSLMLYLIRYGIIPPRLIPRLARHEMNKRRREPAGYFDYREYFFRFVKKNP